jgi:RNA polymerase sigma-70 factor, ECF subfamily
MKEMAPSAALREERAPDVGGAAAEHQPTIDEGRLRRMLDESFDFVWRSLRRFGLSDDRADDAAQQVFIIASRKLDTIRPESERSFLFGTAMRVASDIRRSAVNRREIAHADPAADLVDATTSADELIDQRRARELLDRVLDAMDEELRAVFVLFELEEMATAEIAALLAIPTGTVASRLRRAREEFEAQVLRIKARRGGGP